ncbi:MAG: DUF2332 domain-containing protein [Solirubrobacteraceae bacterium]
MSAKAKIAATLRWQAGACEQLGSPLYAHLLARAADDVEAGGPCWTVLAGHEHDDRQSMPALRFMGAVHRLSLEGRAPKLAEVYARGRPDAWPAFRAAVAEHVDDLRAGMNRGVQTNEVARSAALLGGFLLVARTTGLPLRVLELGASAGLNLRWDAFRYEGEGRAWGDPASPVRLDYAPPVDGAVTVVQRRGCDLNPLDPTTEEGRLTLLSYLWPDMHWRWELMRGALNTAARVPATVDRADAGDWLAARLAEPDGDRVTVIFHSIVMQYLSDAERERVEALIRGAGERGARMAWLRMEPDTAERAGVWLDLWPEGRHARIARAGYHGRPVEWEGW